MNRWVFACVFAQRLALRRSTADSSVIPDDAGARPDADHGTSGADTVIATTVTARAAGELEQSGQSVLVAPALAYGSSGEHQDLAGTSSIGTGVLHGTVVELTRSMSTWASRIVFVNAHGGNLTALRGAVAQLVHEGHDVARVPCATEEVDLHAGRTETSLMLHIAPWNVLLDRAEAGNTGTLEDPLPLMIEGGVKAVSANGVLGDPAGASPEEGAAVMAAMVADAAAFVWKMP